MLFIHKFLIFIKKMVIAVYYAVGGSVSSTTGGGTIQTIVKNGILKSFYDVEEDAAEQESGPVNVLFTVAEFPDGIPNNYKLYYNGQTYFKGQLNEYKLTNTMLRFRNLVWRPSDTLELEYQIIV